MPLQPYAQRTVDERIKELAAVYKAGFNDALRVPVDNLGEPTWIEFLTFLTKFDPMLAQYAHPHLFES